MNAMATVARRLDDDTIAEQIDAYVRKGWAPYPAAEAVIRDLCREGLAEQLLMTYAVPSLFSVWDESRRTPRTMNPASTEAARQANLGRRRVDCTALKRSTSLLESFVQVDGAWMRLGDLDSAACRRGAREQKQAALLHAHHARFLHALAEQLPENTTVRGAFDDRALDRIFYEARPQ
jgi:hypothetical protein